MTNTTQKRGFGQRINNWLDEPGGETFKAGKWRFWFPCLIGFSILNAVLTASIFGSNKQTFISSITLAVGALVAWLCVGTLHYSDSRDARLARGVSLLDSISLCFVIAHFCFLLWAQGHLLTIQANEAEYKASAAIYNEKAEKVSIDNTKIAAAAERIAQEETKRAKIENDTAYQQRKAAQSGARINTKRAGGITPSLSTAPIELERPKAPAKSSAAFLMKWDAWIRGANFGELILAAATLIFIRNRSAKFNAQARRDGEDFPDEIDVDVIEKRSPTRRGDLAKTPEKVTTHVSLKNNDTDAHRKTTQEINREGLRRLRECLKLIAFHHGPTHFKVDAKPDADYLWIRQLRSEHGEARMVASTKAALSILDNAITMGPDAFRERLEKFLRQKGFEI